MHDDKPQTTRLPTQEQITLPPNCVMVQEHANGRVRIYWGKKQVLVGEGLTEEDAIISSYKCLVKNYLQPAPDVKLRKPRRKKQQHRMEN